MKNTEITEHIYSWEGQIYSKKWWFLQFCIQETHYNLLTLKCTSSIQWYQLQVPSLIPKNQHYWTIVFVFDFLWSVWYAFSFFFIRCWFFFLTSFTHSFHPIHLSCYLKQFIEHQIGSGMLNSHWWKNNEVTTDVPRLILLSGARDN